MKVANAELLQHALAQNGEIVKFILNDTAVVFFAAGQQHRDIKAQGLSYEDDYHGNAVAGLVTPNRVEIRYHARYSDERIRTIWSRLRALPELAALGSRKLFYQGREIS